MSHLFTLAFWFASEPIALSPAFNKGFFLLFAACAITAMIARIMSRRFARDGFDRRAFAMAAGNLAGLSVFGFIWLFCSYEEVQIFGVRAWFILWAALLVTAIVRVYLYVYYKAPEMRSHHHAQSVADKYMPRRVR